jgi:hypothetical protein
MVLKFASYTQAVVTSSEVCVMRGHNRKIRKSSVSIKNDEDGSVEGMPLYMMIMVVVVVVSIGILVGIMGGFKGQNLGTVTADPDVIEITDGDDWTQFSITVKDTEGRPIDGATVYIEGEGIATAAKTDGDGRATFRVAPNLGTDAVGELSVRVNYDGIFGEQTRSTSVLLIKA